MRLLRDRNFFFGQGRPVDARVRGRRTGAPSASRESWRIGIFEQLRHLVRLMPLYGSRGRKLPFRNSNGHLRKRVRVFSWVIFSSIALALISVLACLANAGAAQMQNRTGSGSKNIAPPSEENQTDPLPTYRESQPPRNSTAYCYPCGGRALVPWYIRGQSPTLRVDCGGFSLRASATSSWPRLSKEANSS
jgi:hypothetical protein